MKKDVSIGHPPETWEIFDTAIAIMAGLMIIPAVFAFTGGDPDTLQAGPALMFITIPKVFASMGFGTIAGILFFLLVLFAAVTSSIALTEAQFPRSRISLAGAVKSNNRHDRRHHLWSLGSLSCLGYGPLANVTIDWNAVPGFLRFPDKLRHDAYRGHCDLSSGIQSHRHETD